MDDASGHAPGAGNMIVFLLLFLVPAGLTYFSGIILGVGAIAAMEDPQPMIEEATWTFRGVYLGVCYLVMILACFIRGRAVNRVWLVAFPVVGGIFDVLIPFIPFVPSVMNIAALASGIPPPTRSS